MSEADYNKYLRMANYITNKTGNLNESRDLLNDVIIKLIENNTLKNGDGWIFTSIRNQNLDNLQSKSNRIKNNYLPIIDDLLEDDKSLLEEKIKKDKEVENKLRSVREAYELLSSGDKQLFQMYFIDGVKVKDISKDTKFSEGYLYFRINIIKEKIKDYYDKKIKRQDIL